MSTTIATSLKLPADLKQAIDDAARKQGLSSHAYMLKTLADAAGRARLREQFDLDSLAALHEFNQTGLGHDWEDAKTYFAQMAAFRLGQGPRPGPLVPRKLN